MLGTCKLNVTLINFVSFVTHVRNGLYIKYWDSVFTVYLLSLYVSQNSSVVQSLKQPYDVINVKQEGLQCADITN
jgi:hypothetical protein